MAEIRYNGNNPFGVKPPVVARGQEIVSTNGYKSHVDKFTLRGNIPRPSCNADFSGVHSEIQSFINQFLSNFGTFEIIGNSGETNYSSSNAIVRSVIIDQDSFSNFIPYTISIDCIQSYQGLGIVDPRNEYAFSTSDKSIVTVNHSVSCRGIGPNALDNAKSFVDSYRAISQNPMFCGAIPANIVLTSRVETPDRLTGTYSLSETYVYDPNDPSSNYGVLEYEVDVQSSNETAVAINGTITGDIEKDITVVRAKFNAIDFDAIAQAAFAQSGATGTLSGKGQFTVSENLANKQINFTINYSSGLSCTPYIVDRTSISRDLAAGITCMTISVEIKADCGDRAERWDAVKSYYQSMEKAAYVAAKWARFGNGDFLSLTPKSTSVSYADFAASVQFTQTFCTGSEDCGCIEGLNYSLDYLPSIPKYAVRPILDGYGRYNIQNLGYSRRPRFTIRGSCRASLCCEYTTFLAQLRKKINYLCNFYFPGSDKILEKDEITRDSNNIDVSFNFTWNSL